MKPSRSDAISTVAAASCELNWPWRGAVTICPQYINITNLNLNNLNISNSLSYAALQINHPGE